MSWHVPSFISYLLSVLCLLMNCAFSPSLAPSPFLSLLLSSRLPLSLSVSCSVIPPSLLSRCDSIATPVMSAHYLWSVLRSSPHIGSGWHPMMCKCLCVRARAYTSTSYLIDRRLDLHNFLGAPSIQKKEQKKNNVDVWIYHFVYWVIKKKNKGCVLCKQADMSFQRSTIWKGARSRVNVV